MFETDNYIILEDISSGLTKKWLETYIAKHKNKMRI
jgi:hypothetical protein